MSKEIPVSSGVYQKGTTMGLSKYMRNRRNTRDRRLLILPEKITDGPRLCPCKKISKDWDKTFQYPFNLIKAGATHDRNVTWSLKQHDAGQCVFLLDDVSIYLLKNLFFNTKRVFSPNFVFLRCVVKIYEKSCSRVVACKPRTVTRQLLSDMPVLQPLLNTCPGQCSRSETGKSLWWSHCHSPHFYCCVNSGTPAGQEI